MFEFLREPGNLPRWAQAFTSADEGRARLETPAGAVDVGLDPDLSPRLAAMFAEARARSIPERIPTHLQLANASLESRDYARAESELALVQETLEEAETLGALDGTSAAPREIVDGLMALVHAVRSVAVAPAGAEAPTPERSSDRSP